MIASSPRLRRIDPAYQCSSQTALLPTERSQYWLAGVLGFCCFMPYPAIPIGGNAALQMGNLLSIVLVIPLFFMPWNRRLFNVYVAILFPLLLSVLKVSILADGDVPVSFKEAVVWAISCLTILATQMYAPRFGLQIMTGIALATLIHATVGIWQVYSFAQGEFPLLKVYINQSFLSVQNNAESIARYERRPFGIFPEPSAMSSSLSPWVLLWTGRACGLIRIKHSPALWQKALFDLAAAGGLGLIILSQSGHAAITLAALLPLVIAWFLRAKATPRTYAVLLAVFGAVAPAVLYLAADSLSQRLGGRAMGNSSWEERSNSLLIGFSQFSDRTFPSLLFGVGVGQMAPLLWHTARIDAVFSVLLNYLYETGLAGLLGVWWIGQSLLRVWETSRWDLTFFCFTGVWLVGITLTTSYSHLLPIWISLGFLTVWPTVCEPVARPAPSIARRRSIYRVNVPLAT